MDIRTVTTTTATIDEGDLDWPGAQKLIRLKRHSQLANGTTRESTTYAITSLSRTTANAELLLDHSCGRWHIEYRGFPVLDVSLGDDANRTRHVLPTIRGMALNLARRLKQSTPNLCRENALKPSLLLNKPGTFKRISLPCHSTVP